MKIVKRTLDELGYVRRGKSKHRPRDASHLYDGPYPFIQTGDVKNAGLYIKNYTQTYSLAGLAQSKLWESGTLCITIAANIADTSILSFDACFPDSIIGFIPDPNKSDARYIKYLFDAVLKPRFMNFSQGATQDNLSQEKLLSLKLSIVEDVNEQRKIADNISIYDNLIDINRRQIHLLEESARLLFREWFVYFRFPGHEKVKIINGVPEGWKKGLLEDIANVKKGRNITFDQTEGGDIPVIGGGLEPTYYHNKSNVSAPIITISASGANAGYVNLYYTDIWASDCSYINKSSTKYIYFLYLQLKSLQTLISGFQVGAAQPHVYPKDLNRLKVNIVPDDLSQHFEHLIIPIFSLIKNLKLDNQKLAQARDLLLPRLMSGAIMV